MTIPVTIITARDDRAERQPALQGDERTLHPIGGRHCPTTMRESVVLTGMITRRSNDTLRTVRFAPDPEPSGVHGCPRSTIGRSGHALLGNEPCGIRSACKARRCPWNSFTNLTFRGL